MLAVDTGSAPLDDVRLGRALRELRRQAGQTQAQAAAASRVSRRTIGRIERDGAGALTVDTLRRIFALYEARVRLDVWWRGALLDRLLDQQHAALVEHLAGLFGRRGWLVQPEVTFSEWGERGAIDLLAIHPPTGSCVVVEVKTAWGSLEETNRRLDVKVRLAEKLAEQRFGWKPTSVSRLLALPDHDAPRRVAASHAETLALLYPARAREMRTWLRRPIGRIGGLWFVSNAHLNATGSGRRDLPTL